MLNYAAYTIGRVAVAYPEKFLAEEQAGRAYHMLSFAMDAANGSPLKGFYSGAFQALEKITQGSEGNKIELKNSGCYVTVNIDYFVPLKIPLANSMIGAMSAPGGIFKKHKFFRIKTGITMRM